MRRLSETSKELYEELADRGYPDEFCNFIVNELNTDFTARRMLGYLSYFPTLHMEDVVDEMLAILSDRKEWIRKKEMESAQSALNMYMLEGFGDED